MEKKRARFHAGHKPFLVSLHMAPKFLGSYLKIRSKTTHLAQFHHHLEKRGKKTKAKNPKPKAKVGAYGFANILLSFEMRFPLAWSEERNIKQLRSTRQKLTIQFSFNTYKNVNFILSIETS